MVDLGKCSNPTRQCTAPCCTSLYLVVTKNTKEDAPHVYRIPHEVMGKLSGLR